MLAWLKAFYKAVALFCGVLFVVLSIGEVTYFTGQFLHAQFGIGVDGVDAGLFCLLAVFIIAVIVGVTMTFMD